MKLWFTGQNIQLHTIEIQIEIEIQIVIELIYDEKADIVQTEESIATFLS